MHHDNKRVYFTALSSVVPHAVTAEVFAGRQKRDASLSFGTRALGKNK